LISCDKGPWYAANRNRAARGHSMELDTSTLAKLAEDLTILVDQLEMDWDARRVIRRGAVAEVHELRERAERLLKNFP